VQSKLGFGKIDYHSTDEIFEVKIIDNYGAVLDKWKFQKKDFSKWVNIVSKKFGMNVKVRKIGDLDWTNY